MVEINELIQSLLVIKAMVSDAPLAFSYQDDLCDFEMMKQVEKEQDNGDRSKG